MRKPAVYKLQDNLRDTANLYLRRLISDTANARSLLERPTAGECARIAANLRDEAWVASVWLGSLPRVPQRQQLQHELRLAIREAEQLADSLEAAARLLKPNITINLDQ